MAKRGVIYRITVKNWDKYNSTKKKGHQSTLISNNFCTDGKLGVLPVTVRWCFLGIILTCGDHTRDTVEMGEKQLRDLLESSWSISRALSALEELQLVTVQKIEPFINRREEKRKEKKVKELTPAAPSSLEGAGQQILEIVKEVYEKPRTLKILDEPRRAHHGQPIIQYMLARYAELFEERHKVKFKIQGKAAGIAKRLTEGLTHAQVDSYLEAFFRMPDAGVIKARHPLGLMELKFNEVLVFAGTGDFTTQKQAQQADVMASNLSLLAKIRGGAQ